MDNAMQRFGTRPSSGAHTSIASIQRQQPFITNQSSPNRRADTMRARSQAAHMLQQRITDSTLPRKTNRRSAIFAKHSSQGGNSRLPKRLEEHGCVLHEADLNFDADQEKQINQALRTLIQDGGAVDDPEGNVRIAFVSGNKEKIDAALALHELGLIDLNAPNDAGETLPHLIARTAFEPDHAGLKPQRPATMPIAERFMILKQLGIDLDRPNLESQRAIEVAIATGAPNMQETVEALLQAGTDPWKLNANGENLLHVAARCSAVPIIDLLLRRAVDSLSSNRRTAMHLAAQHGTVATVNLLCAKGADVDATAPDGSTMLHFAARNDDPEMVKMLLAKELDVNAETRLHKFTPLHIAAQHGAIEVVNALLRNGASVDKMTGSGHTALHLVAETSRHPVAELMLDCGADVNGVLERGEPTPLHVAARLSTIEMVELLLARGADVEAGADRGFTPLHAAAAAGNARIVERLLDAGADVNAVASRGNTALHIAAQKGQLKIVQMLLEKGIDISAVERCGDTALHVAARYGRTEIVRELLASGMDVNATNYDGLTALDRAMAEYGRADLATVLVKNGAPGGTDRKRIQL